MPGALFLLLLLLYTSAQNRFIFALIFINAITKKQAKHDDQSQQHTVNQHPGKLAAPAAIAIPVFPDSLSPPTWPSVSHSFWFLPKWLE